MIGIQVKVEYNYLKQVTMYALLTPRHRRIIEVDNTELSQIDNRVSWLTERKEDFSRDLYALYRIGD